MIAAASPAAAESLDAPAFARRFERANPQIQIIEAGVEARRADVTEAELLPNPVLSVEREEVFSGGAGTAEHAVILGWSLDLSGRRSRRTDAARHRLRAARARAGDDKLGALIAALGVFYDAAHARLRVTALGEGRAPLARMVEALRARVRAGDAAGYDLTRLELELAAYDQRIAEARVALRAARLTLGSVLGQPSEPIEADDQLALPAAPGSIDALARSALASRGDYRATGLDAASADAELSAARRGWIPRLDLGVGFKSAELGTETAAGYIGIIGLELPLFSRGQADARRARAQKRAARARRARLGRQIPTRVRVARERLAAAIAQARTFRTAQLDRARALVKQAEGIYQGGEASIVELVDAYRTAVDARLGYLALLRRARAAELALSLALGRRPEALQ